MWSRGTRERRFTLWPRRVERDGGLPDLESDPPADQQSAPTPADAAIAAEPPRPYYEDEAGRMHLLL